MDSDRKQQDLLRLNALVDSELPPAERAELAARLAIERDLAHAYSTLARLKAATADVADEMPIISLLPPRRRAWLRLAALAACLAVAISIGIAVNDFMASSGVPDAAEGPTAITLASLPAGTTIPRLDTSGLKLIGLAIDPGQVPLFTATYRGPHGCRLDLQAWPIGSSAPAITGTSWRRWTAGDLVYELVAHGMPAWRFTIIAEAAEQQTRIGSDPEPIDRRLRQANKNAPPCLG